MKAALRIGLALAVLLSAASAFGAETEISSKSEREALSVLALQLQSSDNTTIRATVVTGTSGTWTASSSTISSSPGNEALLATAGHGADLSWAASPDAAGSATLTYNVYRFSGTCPASAVLSQWSKVGSGISGLTFSDTGMTPGQYCYTVTAADKGVESAAANLAPAVIPLSPPSNVVISNPR